MHNGLLHFRDTESMTNNELGKFVLTNANSQTKVWDVSDVTNVTSLFCSLNNSNLTFIDSISSLKTYYAFWSPHNYFPLAPQVFDFESLTVLLKLDKYNIAFLTLR